MAQTKKRRYVVATASAEDVEAFAGELSESFLACRELGHNWKPWAAVNSGRYYERVLRCPRCRCERAEVLSMRGEVLSRQMRYPDGYLAEKIGRIVGEGRDQLRLESLTRFVSRPEAAKHMTEAARPSTTRHLKAV